MSVSKRLRYEILRRDNHTCRYCGQSAPDVKLTVDHVTPVALGGGDEPANLVTACAACNSGKSATPPGAPLAEDVAQDALRWARAIQYAAVQAEEDRDARNDIVGNVHMWFLDIWGARIGGVHQLPTTFLTSIMSLYDGGMRMNDLDECVAVAARRDRDDYWLYFCKVAWAKLRERQNKARQIIDAGLVS